MYLNFENFKEMAPNIVLLNTRFSSMEKYVLEALKPPKSTVIEKIPKNKKNIIGEIKRKPLITSKWFIHTEATDDFVKLLKLNAPIEYARIILTYDFKTRSIIKKFNLEEDVNIGILNLAFPRFNDLMIFLASMKEVEREDLHDGVYKAIIKRNDNVDSYQDFMDIFNYYPSKITQDIIDQVVPDVKQENLNVLAESIIYLQKKKPYEILDKYSSYQPSYILSALQNYFLNLRQAKLFYNKGLKKSQVLDIYITQYKATHTLSESEEKFINQSSRKINYWLEMADKISFERLFFIENELNKFKFVDSLGLKELITVIKNYDKNEIISFIENKEL